MLLPSLFARNAASHELSVDELRLWLPPARHENHELRGQLSFDPELTRTLDADISDDEKRQRVIAFVTRNLAVRVDDTMCALEVEVRELYERGGAVPGDEVSLVCPLTSPPPPDSNRSSGHNLQPASSEANREDARSIEVTVGRDFQALNVEVAGWTTEAATKALTPGGTMATFHRSEPVPDPVNGAPAAPIAKTAGPSARRLMALAASFFRIGLSHVLPGGLDHLLFVVALTLGAYQRLRHVFWLVLTFTLAHTLATVTAALGAWTPPAAVVEPCIAASIAFAGVAVYFQVPPVRSLVTVFGFGLVHGFGFASALEAVSGGVSAFLTSMFAFNLGVEVAQLGVVLLLCALLTGLRRTKLDADKWVATAGIVIAGVGAGWTMLRLVEAFKS